MPYSVKSTDSLRSLLACAYAETIDQIQYEYFSVTDRTGSGALDNSFNGKLNKILVDAAGDVGMANQERHLMRLPIAHFFFKKPVVAGELAVI